MRIAYFPANIANKWLDEVDAELRKQGLEIDWLPQLQEEAAQKPWPETFQSGLQAGHFDAALHSLALLGTEAPEGCSIAALRPAPYYKDYLFCADKKQRGLHQLNADWQLFTRSARVQAQVRSLRPELRVNVDPQASPDKYPELNTAVVLTAVELCSFNELPEGGNPLHPREFPSDAGAKALALLCIENDRHTRRALHRAHDQQLGWQTNVERRLKRQLASNENGQLGVHCERDAGANWHAWATWTPSPSAPLKRAQCSSSTHADLADQVYQNL